MENELTYELHPIGGGQAGGRYRADIRRGEKMDTDEVFEEIAAQMGMKDSANALRNKFEAILALMVENTLRDGRMRRIGDFFELRLDMTGSFERIDSKFNPKDHSLKINLVSLKRLRNLRRETPPKNVMPAPKGRIDSVYSAGVERAGVVNFGRDIVITGEDLVLSERGEVILKVFVPEYKKEMEYRCDLVENGENRLVAKFPVAPSLTKEIFLAAKTAKVIRIEFDHPNAVDRAHGRHVTVKTAE